MRFLGINFISRVGAGFLLSAGLLLFSSISWSDAGPADWPSWGAYNPITLLRSKPPADKWTFVAYGNSRAAEFHRNWGIPRLCELNPALIVSTGNTMEYGGGIWTRNIDWLRWELESRALRDSIPFFPVIGSYEAEALEPLTDDHDLHYTGARHFSLFYELPGESGGECHYSFEYGGVTFIVLDTLEKKLFPGSPQWIWLERTLERTDARHVVTFSHNDIYSVGEKNKSPWEYADEFTALLKRNAVRLHISGRDGIYYRTLRDGVTFIVSAGGGADMSPLKNLGSAERGDKYFTGNGKLNRERYHYYTAFEVNGDAITGKTVSFATGKVLDTFSITVRNRRASK